MKICRQREFDQDQARQIRQDSRQQDYGRIVRNGASASVQGIIDPVYFSSGQASINNSELEKLRQAIRHYSKEFGSVKVEVIGHTDSMRLSARSEALYGDNQKLSKFRAQEVANHLSRFLRLNSSDLVVIGKGYENPVASNDSEEGRALNRRVEISLRLPESSPVDVAGQNPMDGNRVGMGKHSSYYDDSINPMLMPHDQLTFVQKPNWIEKSMVELRGEVVRPGQYVINRGETLCEVLERAGGVTSSAYTFGAELTRVSIQAMQQKTLDQIQEQLDDLLVQLSMSHSARNDEKTPAGDSKDEYLRIIRQLERAKPSGRLVIDLDSILECDEEASVVLEDGDVLSVPTKPTYVNVAGQVYVPTSHMWRKERNVADYIELSGGATVIGRLSHAYVIQANGEVRSYKGKRSSKRIMKMKVQPGANVVVPLNVDRMNGTERVQSWTRILVETALFAGILL